MLFAGRRGVERSDTSRGPTQLSSRRVEEIPRTIIEWDTLAQSCLTPLCCNSLASGLPAERSCVRPWISYNLPLEHGTGFRFSDARRASTGRPFHSWRGRSPFAGRSWGVITMPPSALWSAWSARENVLVNERPTRLVDSGHRAPRQVWSIVYGKYIQRFHPCWRAID